MNALVAQGSEVWYLTAEPPTVGLDPRVQVLRLWGGLGKGSCLWATFLVTGAFQAALLARRLALERLVAFGPFYAALLWGASKVSSASLVLFVRSRLGVSSSRSPLFDRLFSTADRWGVRSASVVVALTQVMKRSVEELLPSGSKVPVLVLPNDIRSATSRSWQAPSEGKPLTALVLGAFSESKNLSFLLEVFSLIERRGESSWRLQVVGKGEALSSFEAQAQARGVRSIEVLPWTENVEPLFLEAALLLHPSRHEGMPNVVLEALSYGVPVLCADIPELRELMVEETCLFSLADPQGLAERLLLYEKNRAEFQVLEAIIHKRRAALTFDWDGRFEQITTQLR